MRVSVNSVNCSIADVVHPSPESCVGALTGADVTGEPVTGDAVTGDAVTGAVCPASTGGWVTGEAVAGALVVGVDVTGVPVAGALVVGVDVTGADVAGAAVTGALVVGEAVVGAVVVGADDEGDRVVGAPARVTGILTMSCDRRSTHTPFSGTMYSSSWNWPSTSVELMVLEITIVPSLGWSLMRMLGWFQ
jgi:hypothetical protein